MTSFRTYIANRIGQLEQQGQTLAASSDAIAEATGRLTAADVGAFLAGHVEIEDLQLARQIGAALGLDETETIEVAGDGQLCEGFGRLADDAFEALGTDRRIAGTDRVLGISEFVYSTGAEARDGDMIDTATWRTGQYSQNPVVLKDHDMRTVVGVSDRPVKDLAGDALTGVVRWDMADDNEAGRLVGRQHHDRIRRAVSVRWLTGKRMLCSELPETDPRYRAKPRIVHTAWGNYERMSAVHFDCTLLEVSSVSIPSDPRALQLRGLGAAAGVALRQVDHRDPAAATDLRAAALEALKDPATWGDPAIRACFAATFRHLCHNDREVRALLRAIGLTAPTPTPPRANRDAIEILFGS